MDRPLKIQADYLSQRLFSFQIGFHKRFNLVRELLTFKNPSRRWVEKLDLQQCCLGKYNLAFLGACSRERAFGTFDCTLGQEHYKNSGWRYWIGTADTDL